MSAAPCQRWLRHRSFYRPAGEPIDPRHFEVAAIDGDAPARAFIETHHYSGTYPAARRRFGLYKGADLVGVAVFSQPVNDASLACLPGEPRSSVELGRLVLLNSVPANGETWFLARCFEALRREGFVGVISFSDPVPRTTRAGLVLFRGHVGTCYQALNATYLGRATPRTLHLLPDASVFSPRAAQKIRSGECGVAYAVEQLVAAGAEEPAPGESLLCWMHSWLPRVTIPLRHRGNHKYAWTLHRRDRRHLPLSLPFPKFPDVASLLPRVA